VRAFLLIGIGAGYRAAGIYSLIATAKLNDIDPEAYLRHLLERFAEYPINHIDESLPWKIAQLRGDQLAA
jgi:transposase